MVATVRVQAAGLFLVDAGGFAVAVASDRVLGVERAALVRHDGVAATLATRLGQVPVVALAALLQPSAAPPSAAGQILLVETDGERLGLWVDKVTALPRSLTPDRADGADAPAWLADLPFAGAVLVGGAAVPLLDLARLFGGPRPAPPPVSAAGPRPAPSVGRSGFLVVVGLGETPSAGGRVVGFGLPAGCVEEVADAGVPAAVPGAAPHLLGLLGWRGGVIPKLDPSAWCGLGPLADPGVRVAVVRVGGGARVAVAVGGETRSVRMTAPHVERPTRLPVAAARVAGVYEFAGLTVVLPRLA